LTAGTEEHERHTAVDRGREDRDQQTYADVLDRLRVEEPLHGADDDREGRDEDHPALDSGREELGLGVTEVVRLIRRLRRKAKHEQRDDGRDQVHDRLGGVGQ